MSIEIPREYTVRAFEAQAAEIKRLEAENAELSAQKEIFRGELHAEYEKVEALKARIALLEAAQQLPEGCDVFELERAQKEGARDAKGVIWRWDKDESENGRLVFESADDFWWFDKDGIARGENGVQLERLYCIKGGGK